MAAALCSTGAQHFPPLVALLHASAPPPFLLLLFVLGKETVLTNNHRRQPVAGRQAAPSERRRPVSREMTQDSPSDDSALRAELQAARAENEMLLQQIPVEEDA